MDEAKLADFVISEHNSPCPPKIQPLPTDWLPLPLSVLPLPTRQRLLIGRVSSLVSTQWANSLIGKSNSMVHEQQDKQDLLT